MQKIAILLGASGLVGESCLQFLLNEPTFSKVKVIVRKLLPMDHPKLEQIVVDFDQLSQFASEIKGDDVFSCLGTTIKVAGSKENFYKVDFTYVHEIARMARSNGAIGFYLVSSMGADQDSLIFYSKVKGQLEEAIKKLNYSSFYIFRPSLLIGERKVHRTGEKIASLINDLIAPIMIGPLKKYKGIHANQVAKAMVTKSLHPQKGYFILLSDAIQDI